MLCYTLLGVFSQIQKNPNSDIFKLDENFEKNEAAYEEIRENIVGDADGSDDESEEEEDAEDDEEQGQAGESAGMGSSSTSW